MSTAIGGKVTLILASCIVWRVEQGEVLLKEINYSYPTLRRHFGTGAMGEVRQFNGEVKYLD